VVCVDRSSTFIPVDAGIVGLHKMCFFVVKAVSCVFSGTPITLKAIFMSRKPSTAYQAAPITFSEMGDVRYLHFGTPWVQGAMNLRRPYQLALEYARMMMAYLLFVHEPSRVAQLGMGCASLTKFTYKYLPQTQSVVVELNPDVIQACYSMFRLPESTRIEVVQADAAAWVAAQSRTNPATLDALQIDLYDASARGPVCDSVDFYCDCRALLNHSGVATINLFGEHESFAHNQANLLAAFDGQVVFMPRIHEGNRIAIAFNHAPDWTAFDWQELFAHAEHIKATYGLAAKRWVSAFKAQVCS
jgi:spermidine synthase